MTPLLLTTALSSNHSDTFDMNKALTSPLPCLDTNEDGVLDEQELEALFTKEVRNPTEHHVVLSLALILLKRKVLLGLLTPRKML